MTLLLRLFPDDVLQIILQYSLEGLDSQWSAMLKQHPSAQGLSGDPRQAHSWCCRAATFGPFLTVFYPMTRRQNNKKFDFLINLTLLPTDLKCTFLKKRSKWETVREKSYLDFLERGHTSKDDYHTGLFHVSELGVSKCGFVLKQNDSTEFIEFCRQNDLAISGRIFESKNFVVVWQDETLHFIRNVFTVMKRSLDEHPIQLESIFHLA